MTITMPGVVNKSRNDRGFIVSWQEPPLTGAKWDGNVATDSPQLLALMGRNGAHVVEGRTRDEMLANADKYISSLLS
jgi:hypothetical protein